MSGCWYVPLGTIYERSGEKCEWLACPLQENVDQMPTGLMLIGNKQDLEEQNEREVSTETGETFAKVLSSP